MGRKKNKKNVEGGNAESSPFLLVDPERVRFQHSRIRAQFSGCGRSVTETLESIRRGEMSPSDLPPIQVLVGDDNWYFSLNNRRLWVLKRCREEGLLANNQIRVRVRAPKSSAEAARYTLENCALEAKIMREPSSQPKKGIGVDNKKSSSSRAEAEAVGEVEQKNGEDAKDNIDQKEKDDSSEEDDSDSDDSGGPAVSNRFSGLF
jgi:hypothetical protein